MAYRDLVREFAQRTRENLLIMEALAAHRPTCVSLSRPWEFTQLVNSLLGLLVFPQQRWFDKLEDTPISQMPQKCWRRMQITTWDRRYGRGPQKGELKDKTFREVAICLRNSIAHCNVELSPEAGGEISRVLLWNKPGGGRRGVGFEVLLDKEDVREIALTFVDQLSTHEGCGEGGRDASQSVV